MNVMDLFAGCGGSILAGKLLGWKTVCAVEWDEYCQKVLIQRQRDGILEPFPIWDDIGTFDGTPWRGRVDCVTAGFPCQPFSVAGEQRGEDDERNMWPDTIRVIREVSPRWCLLENVPNLLVHPYFGTILRDLAESGFDVRWKVLSAAELGFPHKRDRLWIVAESGGNGLQGFADSRGTLEVWSYRTEQLERLLEGEGKLAISSGKGGGVHDGVSNRVDRLKALGNAWVPQVAVRAWEILNND